jgi:hypothetical protein
LVQDYQYFPEWFFHHNIYILPSSSKKPRWWFIEYKTENPLLHPPLHDLKNSPRMMMPH